MQREDEQISKNLEYSLFDSPSRFARSIVNIVLRTIQWLFVIVAWVFWAAFGTAFWIALVFRVLTAYSATFLYAMFTYQTPRPIEQRLRFVTNLWFDGFRNAYTSVFGKVEAPPITVRHSQLLLEVSWSMFFWSGSILVFSIQTAERIFPFIVLVSALSAFIVGTFLGTWRGETILRALRLRPKALSDDEPQASASKITKT